jgi:hypothetical protein
MQPVLTFGWPARLPRVGIIPFSCFLVGMRVSISMSESSQAIGFDMAEGTMT